MSKSVKTRFQTPFIIISLVVLLASSLAWWNPLEKQQLYLSNFLYYERPTESPIVVISIDNQAVSEDGLGKFSSWCRSYYVPMLQKLASYQPSVVGLDILFLSKSEGLCQDDLQKMSSSSNLAEEFKNYTTAATNPNDLALSKAISQVKNLVLAMRVVPESDQPTSELGPKSLIQYPYQLFYQSAPQAGHNRFFQNANGVITALTPSFKQNEQQVPAFSLQIAKIYQGFSDNSTSSMSPNQLLLQDQNKSLKIPLESYSMLINYSEKTDFNRAREDGNGKITIIPLMDFLNDKKDYSSLIRDKIVLIGARYDSSEDRYFTPIDPANKQYGVMIHAQSIQTILDQAWLRNQSLPEQIAVILLLISLTTIVIFRQRISWALPMLAGIILVYEGLAAPLFFRWHGLILNMVYPALGVILASISIYAYRYLTEFKQKNIVANVLGHYVNREVQNTALENGDQAAEIGGTKRDITVIFTDIKGFTSISESLSPQSLVTLLNEYFEVMAAIIEKNGGVIDKFEGDAIMALFGATTPRPDHARSACQAALEMRAALPGLVEKWHHDPPLPGGEPKPEIDFRVGISSGSAIVGNIGTSQKIEFTAIGDIVNLGSRLESANKKYQTRIMISEATFEQIQNFYECRFLDLVRVKGKQQPVKTYQLLCPKGQLDHDQHDLILEYNHGLQLYFESRFAEADQVFQEIIFHWPDDYLSKIYAGRCELLKRFPPTADWDFVYNLESK